MPAYMVAIWKEVHDRQRLEEYWARVGATLAGSGAKPLAVFTPFKHLEGNLPAEGVVLIEFPDVDTASRWYRGEAYQAVRQYRVGAADIEIFLAGGGMVTPEDRMPHTEKAAP